MEQRPTYRAGFALYITLTIMRGPSLLPSIYASTVLAGAVLVIAGFYSAWEAYATGAAPFTTVLVLPFLAGAGAAVSVLPKEFHWVAWLAGILFEVLVALVAVHSIRYFKWRHDETHDAKNDA